MAISDRRKRERERRRTLILNAAAEEFSRFGIEGASMDGIARRAELGKATLYYYFDTKESLYNAVVESAAEAFFSHLLAAGGQPATLAAATSALLHAYADFCRTRPAWLRVMAPFIVRMSRSAWGLEGQEAAHSPTQPGAHQAWLEGMNSLLAASPWATDGQGFVAFLTDCFLAIGQRAMAGQDRQLDARIAFYVRIAAHPPHLLGGGDPT